MNTFHSKEYANARHLVLLTTWCGEEDIPTLIKFRDQVLKDPARKAVIVQDLNTYAVAVDNVSGVRNV